MPDLSDPTALPDPVFFSALAALEAAGVKHSQLRQQYVYAVTPILAAHFATELDGLRAQIEEALRLRNKPGAHKEHVLAAFDESPRGTVARIQAEALDAVDARIQRQMDAEEKKEPTPSSTGHWSGLAEAQQLLRTALREGAGQ